MLRTEWRKLDIVLLLIFEEPFGHEERPGRLQRLSSLKVVSAQLRE